MLPNECCPAHIHTPASGLVEIATIYEIPNAATRHGETGYLNNQLNFDILKSLDIEKKSVMKHPIQYIYNFTGHNFSNVELDTTICERPTDEHNFPLLKHATLCKLI